MLEEMTCYDAHTSIFGTTERDGCDHDSPWQLSFSTAVRMATAWRGDLLNMEVLVVEVLTLMLHVGLMLRSGCRGIHGLRL